MVRKKKKKFMTRTWEFNGGWDFEIEIKDDVMGAIETPFRHINTFRQLSKQNISLRMLKM